MKTIDIEKLVNLIADGIRILRIRDGKPVTDEMCHERARNIAASVIGAYELRELPEVGLRLTVDFEDPRIAGKPVGHSWSCNCPACHTYKFNEKRGSR